MVAKFRQGKMAGTAGGEGGCGFANSGVHGFAAKIVRRNHSSFHSSKGRGNFWIARVRVVDFVPHVVNPGLSRKCFRHLYGGAAEEDGAASGRDLFHFHAVRRQPCGNLRGTGLRDPERLAKFFWSEH